jgi:hypothetical protein
MLGLASLRVGDVRSETDGYAFSMSGGVKTAAALGINLSISSNYSSTHTLYYKLNTPGKLCGSNALPSKATEVKTTR